MVKSFIIALIIGLSLVLIQAERIKTKLTEEEQTELIAAHNKWRSMVKVSDIKWSDELATEAQKWANHLAKKGCRMQHSTTQNGENIYWSTYASTPEEVVDDWASEKKYYKGRKLVSSKIHQYGHYTQVVWYNTTYVGCGRAKCKNGEEIWVCTYAPSGNYIGEKPY